MVAMVEQLQRLRRQRVSLEFQDGEIVDAILKEVDTGEHQEIIFDVLAVRKAISDEKYPRTKVYTAPISTVIGVTPLP
jgi:hypothetical protein